MLLTLVVILLVIALVGGVTIHPLLFLIALAVLFLREKLAWNYAVSFGQIGLRRALHRRHSSVVAAHGAECRLWALSAWAFPDVWRACGGHRVAQPVLRRCP